MRLDPQVEFGLRILRAPLWGVTWKVHADRHPSRRGSIVNSPTCTGDCSHVSAASTNTASRRVKRPIAGHAGSKTRLASTATTSKNFTRATLAPWSGNAANAPASLPLGCIVTGASTGEGSMYLDRLHTLFCKGEAEFGDWWGRPRLAGALRTVAGERPRPVRGAIDKRRLWYQKERVRWSADAIPGSVGRTWAARTPGPMLTSKFQDIAREIIEKFESGRCGRAPQREGSKR